MKRWLWIILLLPGSPLFAKGKKFEGYVMDAAAFRAIQSYCIDTHNLPPREVKVIDQFILQESKPKGLLTKLPWHLLATCQDGGPEAIARVEFAYNHPPTRINRHDIKGVLLLFRAGSPSPIYETQALPMAGLNSDLLNPGYTLEEFERNALDSVIRILIHDLQKI